MISGGLVYTVVYSSEPVISDKRATKFQIEWDRLMFFFLAVDRLFRQSERMAKHRSPFAPILIFILK